MKKTMKISLCVVFIGLLTSVSAFGQELGGYSFVPISGTPHDVVYDNARNQAYVSNRTLNRIDIVSLATQTVTSSIPVGNMPTGMAISPDGSKLLVMQYNDENMGVVDLTTNTLTQTIALPVGRSRNYPLRVDYDSSGTCIWRDGGPGNPYGYAYSLDLDTGTSTRLIPGEPDLFYAPNADGSKFLFIIDYGTAAIWDSATQSSSTPQNMPDVGSGSSHSDWMTQGAINNSGDTIMINRAGNETLVFDGSFNYQGITTGMAWGTFGPWNNHAIIVESTGGENASNRVSLLDTAGISVIDTLVLPENIGVNEYNFGSRPITLTGDAQSFLAVGQTGLFIIDSSAVPEPATMSLLVIGGLGLIRRKRK